MLYDSGRKASSTDYWVQRVILVHGAMSMLGENFVFFRIYVFVFGDSRWIAVVTQANHLKN